jgi:apolipoprotein D and lipocalin family protein
MKFVLLYCLLISSLGCSSVINPNLTAKYIEIEKFMGDWYVIAGRFTFLEIEVHNGLETYLWNKEKNLIEVSFTYNKGSFTGEKKSIPQTAWIYNQITKAHWKVSPFWPLKFDYLILDVDENYTWTAIGVPNQKYLWIMARSWQNTDSLIREIIKRLNSKGYNTDNIVFVPHQWEK